MMSRPTRSSTRKLRDRDESTGKISPPPAKRAKTQRATKVSHTDDKDTKCDTTSTEAKDAKLHTDQSQPVRSTLIVREETGDIFSAPPRTLLIHACNCEGSWGAGIALAFRQRYSQSFIKYAQHCATQGHKLMGQAFLIEPESDAIETKQHFVGCLFTSRSKGKKADSPAKILKSTGPAMRDLMAQVREWNERHPEQKVAEVRMCKINSGLFRVPWENTKAELEKIEVGELDFTVVKVVSLAE